ncbi:RuBisCO large subunit-binding protein subunit beta, chloroplastic [Tanacetum coccineum]
MAPLVSTKFVLGLVACQVSYRVGPSSDLDTGSCTRAREVMMFCTIKSKPLALPWGRTPRLSSGVRFEYSELADLAAESAGNKPKVGNMIAEAMSKVGRQGIVTFEDGKSAENSMYVVEGMQIDCGYLSPNFVTDSEKMTVEYENCKLLLADKKGH